VELNRDPGAFSELIGLPVRDGSGRSLGRAFEVRAHWDRDGQLVFDELLFGRGTLWLRLRGPGPKARGITWENIAEITPEQIVVRG
jgi:hypothetical protein